MPLCNEGDMPTCTLLTENNIVIKYISTMSGKHFPEHDEMMLRK
ncbi:MAG: hypothetical protein VSS75_015750 [Candidatus Parabeggiatoa sp.]|nr:hypothetical protein [Candidatus Parabeggiatoa sp.]